MDWSRIFYNYKLASYEMYMWIIGSKSVNYKFFTEELFTESLKEKGYFENEEKAFEFFDAAFIWCHVMPIGISKFKSVAESEYRQILSSDWTSRRETSLKTLESAFELLEERKIKEPN